MVSPLVKRLTAQIEAAADPENRAVLLAELACYWARTGDFDEAESIRADLRRRYGDHRSVAVSVSVMALESILLYFRDFDMAAARDRMMRANVLSKSFGEDRMAAFTGAWMGLLDYNLGRYRTMADSLSHACKYLPADDGTVISRIALVLAPAFLNCGKPLIAKQWYDRAHLAAVKIGDQAAIGALIYNRAALRVTAARFNALTQPVSSEFSLLHAEVQSAINYQLMMEIKSLDFLLTSAKIGAKMLRKEFVSAEIDIIELLELSDLPADSVSRKLLEADRMVIMSLSGRKQEPLAWVNNFSTDALKFAGNDDTALLLAAAEKILTDWHFDAEAERFRQRKLAAIAEHGRALEVLLDCITKFADGPL